MSSASIISSWTTSLVALSIFDSGDVVTDDWSILDQVGSHESSPYFMWHVPDTFVSRKDAPTTNDTWEIEGELILRFVKWPTTKALFDVTRQTILDKFNAVNALRSPVTESDLLEIRSNGPIEEIYDLSAFDNQAIINGEAIPMWLSQKWLFIIQEGFD